MINRNWCRGLMAAALLALTGCGSTPKAESVDWPRAEYPGSAAPERVEGEEPPAAAGALDDTDVASLYDSADLERYIAYGLAQSAMLEAESETWKAAVERVEQASALPDPRLSYAEFLEPVETRTGPQQRRIGVSQSLPWPGHRSAKARVAEREASAGWQRVLAARLRLISEIEVAYYEYGYFAQELSVRRELLSVLRGIEPIVQGHVRSGSGGADLLRLQVEIGRVEDDVASLLGRRPVLSARLASAMSLRNDQRLLPLPQLGQRHQGELNTAELREVARERNPQLRGLVEELGAQQGVEELAAFRRRPTLRFGIDYIQTDRARGGSIAGSGDDPVLVGVSMTLPIWGSKYAAGEREARHRVRAAQEWVRSAEDHLRAELEHHVYQVEDAARRIALYESSLLPRAREALELNLAAYRTGGASILDLIDSERVLIEFELALSGARRDYLQGGARLRALAGGEDVWSE